jgi:hypothetical protein
MEDAVAMDVGDTLEQLLHDALDLLGNKTDRSLDPA